MLGLEPDASAVGEYRWNEDSTAEGPGDNTSGGGVEDSCFVTAVVDDIDDSKGGIDVGGDEGGEEGGGDLDLVSLLVLVIGVLALDKCANDVKAKLVGVNGTGLDFRTGKGLVVESGWFGESGWYGGPNL